MYVDFAQMPDTAKLWIYQAGRQLSVEEVKTISAILLPFTQQWLAHGQPLRTGYKIMYDRFLILAVDESLNNASGCSIDGSTRVVKQIEDTVGVSFMDRTIVAFLDHDKVFTLKITELEEGLQSKKWDKETLTFDNLVPVKAMLEKAWVVPARDTWLKKYLTKVTAF
jgi:hypothetical protein